jgi:hypothetical protein
MPKKPRPQFPYNGVTNLNSDEIECAFPISDEQLDGSRIFSSREAYVKTLPYGISYMELGVAWGYYSDLVAKHSYPKDITLVDWYNQDLKCWSWRKFGECQCDPKHEYKYSSESHQDYVQKMFEEYNNLSVIKGDARDVVPSLDQKFDYVYIDVTNERLVIREILNSLNNKINVGGLIGLNDYLIYDGIIDDMEYGTFQSVNEFLHFNRNWKVDAMALHVLGFYDIYIRKINE